jgi:hypothetical protein
MSKENMKNSISRKSGVIVVIVVILIASILGGVLAVSSYWDELDSSNKKDQDQTEEDNRSGSGEEEPLDDSVLNGDPEPDDYDGDDQNSAVEYEEEGFTFNADYTGDDKWSYTIKGDLPNPCYTFSVEEIIRESYPVQVDIVLSIKNPDSDKVCPQVLEPMDYSDTVEAQADSPINFSVNRE